MTKAIPGLLIQGDQARLFPVLSDTSKEGRTTSILLACMARIDELGRDLLSSAGQRVGKRAEIDTYTEIVFEKRPSETKDRPDGLIVLRVGSRTWSAIVEAKVGSNELDTDQVERYRQLARDNAVDCVITISNQFSSAPDIHPVEGVRKSRSKIPVVHWSWMHVLTTADLLLSNGEVEDVDQLLLLNELRRFLTHDSAGVKGFDRMPREWTELNRLVATGGIIAPKSAEAIAVVEAWRQETRDLSLILSRMTETKVEERISKKYLSDPSLRSKDDLDLLCEQRQMHASLTIEDAAAPMKIVVDLARRSVDVGMVLKAPEDRKSAPARLNWLLRQISTEETSDLHIRVSWPGRSPQTQHTFTDLKANPDLIKEGKDRLAPTSFEIVSSKILGGRFMQQVNFIKDLENLVPAFYNDVGSSLAVWQKPAPKFKEGRDASEDVSVQSISGEASAFEE